MGQLARRQAVLNPENILTVAACDTDTGKDSQEDRKRREAVAVRNAADSMAYQVERRLAEAGDRVPVNERAPAEELIGEIRPSSGSRAAAPPHRRPAADRVRNLLPGVPDAGAAPGGTGDVIDAEFTKKER